MTIRPVDQVPTTDPRPLSLVDLTACLELADNREWPYEDRKWDFLLRVGQGYGIVDAAGKLAASAVLTRFGGVAAISMVLVADRYEGRGLGKRIMRHVMGEAGDSVVTLYATDKGRPLYEKLGFQAVSGCEVLLGGFTGTAPHTTRLATADDLPAILRLDAEVLGVDRTHVLARLPEYADRIRVVERGGAVTGYAAASRAMSTQDYAQVGPVVADDEADARALIADLAAGGRIRVDLDPRQPDLLAWGKENGLEVVFQATSMVVDGTPLPGDRTRLFAPLLQAIG
ncbi:Ribosomal protein S18 acetylase RimI [Actinokineospora alba]|uniref:Ribosomal protein S18 acetylase RimI n=1 Tax=Actinokineospora alba TaxID=504798 RepID=A0A1H0PB08_9PSEU|nr:GNAT family N-acetyltransferase [Actinokineospora alba]TDP65721.1 ribosomal protein S18 acetylase RimI-like enzyme [Actinokineospora alba]SDI66651.1 Ribosomal protein S18 acetylase RimI [Actinokineospora alba]SDP02317.1 Ribosomal protein S18 acetylase RimI [Actinokineospora alba]